MIDNHYISIDPNIAFGKPCIAGTRISVEFILELLALGYTIDGLLDEYPQLTREQIYAVLNFARESVHVEFSRVSVRARGVDAVWPERQPQSDAHVRE